MATSLFFVCACLFFAPTMSLSSAKPASLTIDQCVVSSNGTHLSSSCPMDEPSCSCAATQAALVGAQATVANLQATVATLQRRTPMVFMVGTCFWSPTGGVGDPQKSIPRDANQLVDWFHSPTIDYGGDLKQPNQRFTVPSDGLYSLTANCGIWANANDKSRYVMLAIWLLDSGAQNGIGHSVYSLNSQLLNSKAPTPKLTRMPSHCVRAHTLFPSL